jgi:hypothetical protein
MCVCVCVCVHHHAVRVCHTLALFFAPLSLSLRMLPFSLCRVSVSVSVTESESERGQGECALHACALIASHRTASHRTASSCAFTFTPQQRCFPSRTLGMLSVPGTIARHQRNHTTPHHIKPPTHPARASRSFECSHFHFHFHFLARSPASEFFFSNCIFWAMLGMAGWRLKWGEMDSRVRARRGLGAARGLRFSLN